MRFWSYKILDSEKAAQMQSDHGLHCLHTQNKVVDEVSGQNLSL